MGFRLSWPLSVFWILIRFSTFNNLAANASADLSGLSDTLLQIVELKITTRWLSMQRASIVSLIGGELTPEIRDPFESRGHRLALKNFIGATKNKHFRRPERARARHVACNIKSFYSIPPLGQWLLCCSKWEWRRGKEGRAEWGSEWYLQLLSSFGFAWDYKVRRKNRPGWLWTKV